MRPPQPKTTTEPLILRTLKDVWGYEHFRPPQREIIRATLTQQDILAILPTGGGKSICFQLPALLNPGLTLVISPLVALMEDQVSELKHRGIAAERLHSQLDKVQRRRVFKNLHRLKLLYLSPETLFSEHVWLQLCDPALPLGGIVLDEAHCVVQWGQSFRPAYARLGAVRRALQHQRRSSAPLPVAAFTATADLPTQRSLIRSLQLDHPEIFQKNIYRSNLHLSFATVWTPRQRRQKALRFVRQKLQAYPHQSGLIYVRTRRDGEALAQEFRQQGFQTVAYHAGLSDRRRRQIERDWLENRLPFVICTSAFGMGVNKANVRWVLHYHLPLLLSEYVQEVGRGGRDGLKADILGLVSEPTGWLEPSDRLRNEFFREQQVYQQRTASLLHPQLPPLGKIADVKRCFPEAERALATLHHQGQVNWIDPFNYSLTTPRAQTNLASSTQKLPSLMMTQTLVQQQACRWQSLLKSFGCSPLKQTCGHCDRCCT